MSDAAPLVRKTCSPCESTTDPLPPEEVHEFMLETPGWALRDDGQRILRSWTARDFAAGMDFLNRVAALAEAEGHHPDVFLTGYRRVTIELTTHAIDGLSENDFILAAKINELPIELKPARRQE